MTSEKCKFLFKTPLGLAGVRTQVGKIANLESYHSAMRVFAGQLILTV